MLSDAPDLMALAESPQESMAVTEARRFVRVQLPEENLCLFHQEIAIDVHVFVSFLLEP